MTLNGFAYGELSFGADGQPADPSQRGAAPAVALGADVTDLLVLSHGWLDDPPRAQILYSGLTAAIAQAGGAPPGLAVLGILWPAKRFDAEPEVEAAAVAAGAGDPSGRAAESFVTRIRHRVGGEIERLPVSAEYANPGDHQAAFFGLEPRTLLERFGSLEDGISAVMNLATYYEMKARAGAVGKGLVPVLAAVRAARPEVRLHLAGHSFGARVMASALTNCEPFPVSSMTLIQGAFSQFGFAKQWDGVHDGLFRPGLFGGRLKGPVVVTYSHHDEMVGIPYELASRLAGDQPDTTGMVRDSDVRDEFGAIGRHGALSSPESVWGRMLPVEGAGYAFPAGAISNLDSAEFVSSHFHVMTPEMGKVLVAAMAVREAPE
ncbi:hypothetical protein ABIA35_000355 [Catenulispora sp. MAP12-49]